MEDQKKILLQRLGEDTAYTFKGLYKQSDWLELKYQLFLSVPIIFSIVTLGFDQELPEMWLKVGAVASLILTFLALMDQKKLESVNAYRDLADEIKVIYDLAEKAFRLDEFEIFVELQEKWSELRSRTRDLPIGFMGRHLSKRKIKKEMNLDWLT